MFRRYRRTGTVLEVVYSLKDAADRINSTNNNKNNRRSVLDDIVDTGNDSHKVLQFFQDNVDGDELYYNSSNNNNNNNNKTGSAAKNGGVGVESIELLNYRRLNSGSSQHLVKLQERHGVDVDDGGNENEDVGANTEIQEEKNEDSITVSNSLDYLKIRKDDVTDNRLEDIISTNSSGHVLKDSQEELDYDVNDNVNKDVDVLNTDAIGEMIEYGGGNSASEENACDEKTNNKNDDDDEFSSKDGSNKENEDNVSCDNKKFLVNNYNETRRGVEQQKGESLPSTGGDGIINNGKGITVELGISNNALDE